ncbi:MAG: O-antigen ligase family protein [Patescibacteria group bacterium]|nr:O-antigen ligase family protein [Patescibacteria group bacterium]
MSSILILFLIFYLILAKIRLDWAIMLFLFALPSYQIRFDCFGVPATLLEAMILISFAVWLFKNYKKIIKNVKIKLKNPPARGWSASGGKSGRYPFDIEIILMLLIAFVSIAIAGFTDPAFGVFKAYFFESVLVFILIINVFLNKELRSEASELSSLFKKTFWPLAFSAFFVSFYAILQKIGLLYSPENFLPRVTGTFFYPNALGLYLGPILIVMIGFFLHGIKKIQDTRYKIQTNSKSQITNSKQIYPLSEYRQILFILATIILSLLAIFFAKSEGALIGIFVALFIMLLVWLFNKFSFSSPRLVRLGRIIPKIIISFILIFAITSPFIYLKIIPEHKYFNFNSNTLNYISDKTMLKDFSGEVRKQQWRETWQFLSASPKNFIFGAGLSGYQKAIKPYHQEGIFFNSERDIDFRRKLVLFDEKYKAAHWRPVEIYMYPHNLILNFWVELGLAGVLLFVWIIGKMVFLSIKQDKFIVLGLLGAVMVIVVHGLVDVPYFKNDLAVMFWVFAAVLGMTNLDNKKLDKKSS